MKRTRLELPTQRLTLSCAGLTAILPGFKRICPHLSGSKLESHLDRDPNDPILIRLSDRYANKQFDQGLARSFRELKDRLLAINRNGGGDLQVTLPDLTMIAFAVRQGNNAQKRRKSGITPLENRLENSRKRLYWATVSEVGAKFYEDFRERWSAFMDWITHELRYEALSSRRREARRVVTHVSTLPPTHRPLTREQEGAAPPDPVELGVEEWIKQLAERSHSVLPEMELKRGVRLAKNKARKGGFDFYTLADILTDKKRFEPKLERLLIENKVIIDLSVAQATRAARIREKSVIRADHADKASQKNDSATTVPVAERGETLDRRGPSIGTLATSSPIPGPYNGDFTLSNFPVAQPNPTNPPDTTKAASPDREELVRCTVLYLAPMSESFRSRVFFELTDIASSFVPNPGSSDLKEPSEHFGRLDAKNLKEPFMEAKGILTILCRYVSVQVALEIVEAACASFFRGYQTHRDAETSPQA